MLTENLDSLHWAVNDFEYYWSDARVINDRRDFEGYRGTSKCQGPYNQKDPRIDTC